MPKLADIQSTFIDALVQPEASVPDAVGEKGGRPAKRRFDVYRNNVAAGMTEALRATYPAIEKLVGVEFFAATARVYWDRCPPRSPLLFHYGAAFGNFLDGFPPAASTPYLGDVARLEWARLEAYHAKDKTPLTIDALSNAFAEAADVGTLRMELHPALGLIKSRWPVLSLWAASTGLGSSSDVDMNRAEQALVIRPHLTVEARLLHADSFAFMTALHHGRSLQQAAVDAADVDPAFDLAEHMKGLFAVGAVSAIKDQTQ